MILAGFQENEFQIASYGGHDAGPTFKRRNANSKRLTAGFDRKSRSGYAASVRPNFDTLSAKFSLNTFFQYFPSLLLQSPHIGTLTVNFSLVLCNFLISASSFFRALKA